MTDQDSEILFIGEALQLKPPKGHARSVAAPPSAMIINSLAFGYALAHGAPPTLNR